jgi:hypothetical protein
MVSMTLSIPEDMREQMEEHPEINWSEVARQSFDEKLHELEILESFNADSELTDEDAIELGRKLNADLAERYDDGDAV